TGGTQIGTTVELSFGKLPGGRFAAKLDFGRAAFNGEARWLEISVRTPAGSDPHPGTYHTLTPRQLRAATPYALSSLNGGPPGPAGPPRCTGAPGGLGPPGPQGPRGARAANGPPPTHRLGGLTGTLGRQ